MSADAIEAAWESSATTASPFRTQLYRALLLTVGALLAGVAHAAASWLVGLFASSLPLPAGATLGATIVVYSVLVYYVALDTNEDGETWLDVAIGRVA